MRHKPRAAMARAVYGARAVPESEETTATAVVEQLPGGRLCPALLCPPLLLCCCGETRAANDPSVFTITEKAPIKGPSPG